MDTNSISRRNLPDIDQLSVVLAMIMLTYAFVPFLNFPSREISFSVSGVVFTIPLNTPLLVSVISAVMAATGVDWMIRQHPRFKPGSVLLHEMLPAFSALVIGIPINTIPMSLQWWMIFGFGGILLMGVFIAEYVSVDRNDVRYVLATVSLTAVSFALFLFLAISVRGAGLRLYLGLPITGLAMLLVCLRSLYMKLGNTWHWEWALGITLIVCQVIVGLHYFPLTPLAYGLILLGTGYGLTGFAASIIEGNTVINACLEPGIMFLVFLIAALLLG